MVAMSMKNPQSPMAPNKATLKNTINQSSNTNVMDQGMERKFIRGAVRRDSKVMMTPVPLKNKLEKVDNLKIDPTNERSKNPIDVILAFNNQSNSPTKRTQDSLMTAGMPSLTKNKDDKDRVYNNNKNMALSPTKRPSSNDATSNQDQAKIEFSKGNIISSNLKSCNAVESLNTVPKKGMCEYNA